MLTQWQRKFLGLSTSCNPILVNGISYMCDLKNELKDQMYLESRIGTIVLSLYMLPNLPSISNVKMAMTLLSYNFHFVLI